jgi:multiple antibiotic resistance protein
MNELLQHSISVFLSFFAIMNPIANTAVFVGLVGNASQNDQRLVAFKALILTFVIILLFAVLGNTLFNLFGITLPALRITGGILVFLIGYQMIHGERSTMHSSKETHFELNHSNQSVDLQIAVSPLAVPILAGPGTIATAMNNSATGNVLEIIITVVMFACLCVITFFSFIYGEKIIHKIGENGLNIVTRLMGLILAVIGTQMLIEGVYGAINAFVPQ